MSDDLDAHLHNRAAHYARHFSPLATLQLVWHQVPPEDRVRFLTETLTPRERRALLGEVWDTDPEEEPPVPFLYTIGQRLCHAQRGWVGDVVQRRYTERAIFGPVIEYCLEFPEGELLWTYEPDVVPVEAPR